MEAFQARLPGSLLLRLVVAVFFLSACVQAITNDLEGLTDANLTTCAVCAPLLHFFLTLMGQ
jgi:hypothetical protein